MATALATAMASRPDSERIGFERGARTGYVSRQRSRDGADRYPGTDRDDYWLMTSRPEIGPTPLGIGTLERL